MRSVAVDILVNNASAIWLRGTLDTPMKRFDLMQQVNSRGSFLCAQACLPWLLQAPTRTSLRSRRPAVARSKVVGRHTGYTLAKMGMSFVTLGLAAEFGPQGVAINALWPRTVIATDAINMIPGVEPAWCRKPDIARRRAHAVLSRTARGFSGQFLIDEDVLRDAGVTDFRPTRSILPNVVAGPVPGLSFLLRTHDAFPAHDGSRARSRRVAAFLLRSASGCVKCGAEEKPAGRFTWSSCQRRKVQTPNSSSPATGTARRTTEARAISDISPSASKTFTRHARTSSRWGHHQPSAARRPHGVRALARPDLDRVVAERRSIAAREPWTSMENIGAW
jgi:NAD(P)-dependent dehydrogenase (short-subunit alcohol dehydrogenase family)